VKNRLESHRRLLDDSYEDLDIIGPAARIDDAGAQGEATIDRRAGKERLATELHVFEDRLVQYVKLGIVEIRTRNAEADNAQVRWRYEFEIGSLLDQRRELSCLREIVLDRATVAVESVILDRHPGFQCPESPALLRAIFTEPGETVNTDRCSSRRQIIRNEAECPPHCLGIL